MIRIPLITSLIHYFKVVYGYTGKKLYTILFLFLFGSLSESVGISLLLPVLDVDRPVSDQGQYTKTIYNMLELIGINISMISLITLLLITFISKEAFVYLQKTFSYCKGYCYA